MIQELTNKHVSPDSMISDLEFDELDFLESVMIVEEEFNIEIDDDEWENVLKPNNKVSTIIDFIGEKCKN